MVSQPCVITEQRSSSTKGKYLVICEVFDLTPEYGVPAQRDRHVLHHLRDLRLQAAAH
jgi:hypothetical protein